LDDLEHRGLLQYDRCSQRYDLHPVVRGVAAGSLMAEDMKRYGQRVVDHFNSKPHNPYEQAKAMADVEAGLQVVRTLLKLGHHQQAADAFHLGLVNALSFNLEAHVETLALLRPFFRAGWDRLPNDVDADTAGFLANAGGVALAQCSEIKQAIGAFAVSLQVNLEREDWELSGKILFNISESLSDLNRLSQALRVYALAFDCAILSENIESIFKSRLQLFAYQTRLGQWSEAEATWQQLDPMGRRWNRSTYRQGNAEGCFAQSQFWQGRLQEGQLITAATLSEQDHNRASLRDLHKLRGTWRLEQGHWALAAASFTQAVILARELHQALLLHQIDIKAKTFENTVFKFNPSEVTWTQ
jgi:tetratricopeptide (TPR) repeat protein